MKYLTYITILILVMGMVGCSSTITNEQWAHGEYLCEPNGGLQRLKTGHGFETAYCNNGGMFNFSMSDYDGKHNKTTK